MHTAAVSQALRPEADALVAEARCRTGLEDFSPDSFEAPLARMLEGMRDEAGLSEAGMQAQLEEIIGHLSITLRAQACFAAHPEIDEQEITAPVVIVGLQRTGTSKLFRDIAADPQWNVLYTWLALDPVPPAESRPGLPDPRIAAAERWCEGRRWFARAHSFDPTAPEMEAMLLLHTFMLNNPARLMPRHQAWLETADFAPAYRYLKRLLKLLQWQSGAPPGKRWILKSPPHLLTLDALVDAFPDAQLVMTHRHPRASVGSMFKLTELAQQRSAKRVDRDRIRELWLRNLSTAIERFMAFRAARPEVPFIDLAFGEFVGDPLPAVRRIYEFAGMDYTAATAEAVAAWHGAHPRHSEGKFEYSLAEFGASDAIIDAAFADYISAYRDWL